MKIRSGAALIGAAVLAMSGIAGAAQAATPKAATCSGGDIASGTYKSLTVTGACTVPAGATITVLRNLTIKPGAMFIADSAPSDVRINGNVFAGPGSSFGFGCTPAHGCETGDTFSHDSVGGNVVLDHVFNAALDGVEIGKNVVSTGGGGGFVFPDGFIPFSIKDDVIHGSVIVAGLKTTWFGIIRSTIDGSVVLKDIQNDDPDGNEIVHDTIGNNLVCLTMSPAPQIGDADEGQPPGYQYSTVGGQVIGQCGFVLAPR
jgi:hypothetical protein